MPKELVAMQMKFLESHIGDEGVCIYYEKGERKEIKGPIKLVEPFDRIVIGTYSLPFVGASIIIEQVSANGSSVYYYSGAKDYIQLFETDHYGLVMAQKEILGYSVKDVSMNASYNEASEDQKPQSIPGGRGYHKF
ncbi:MAG: hypothetical protein OSJ63_06315 [Bacilli bacterium]|nr:hypothetical protein [Bacilli bacterium]